MQTTFGSFWPIGEDFGPRQTGPVIEVLRPSAMLSGVGGFGLDRCYYLRAFGRRGLYCSSRRRSHRRQRLMPGTGHECQSSSAGFPRPPCSISRTTQTSLPIALMRKMPTTLQEQMTTGSRPNRLSCSTSYFGQPTAVEVSIAAADTSTPLCRPAVQRVALGEALRRWLGREVGPLGQDTKHGLPIIRQHIAPRAMIARNQAADFHEQHCARKYPDCLVINVSGGAK